MLFELIDEYCKKYTYLHKEFADSIGIMILATLAKNDFMVEYGDTLFKLNMYTLLIAPSRAGKGKAIVETTKTFINNTDPALLLPEQFTTEAIIKELSTRPQGVGIVCNDELSNILRPGVKYMKGISDFLTGIYSATDTYTHSLSSKEYKIINPALNLFFGVQLPKLAEIIKTEQIASGFIPRFNLVCTFNRPQPSDEQLRAPIEKKEQMAEDKQKIELTLKFFNKIIAYNFLPIRIQVDWEAVKYISQWDSEKQDRILSESELTYLNTRREFAFKISGLLVLNKVIADTIYQLIELNNLCDKNLMNKLIGLSDNDNEEEVESSIIYDEDIQISDEKIPLLPSPQRALTPDSDGKNSPPSLTPDSDETFFTNLTNAVETQKNLLSPPKPPLSSNPPSINTLSTEYNNIKNFKNINNININNNNIIREKENIKKENIKRKKEKKKRRALVDEDIRSITKIITVDIMRQVEDICSTPLGWKCAFKLFNANLSNSKITIDIARRATEYLDELEEKALFAIKSIMGSRDEKLIARVTNSIKQIISRNRSEEVFYLDTKEGQELCVSLRSIQRATGLMLRNLQPVIEALICDGVIQEKRYIKQDEKVIQAVVVDPKMV
ncbi:DUF3987 domain-containing protein [Caldisericum sp.]|uniref:DUF3987 domain-containing protein n=1 Tax=Caldisericum sp. TaxID=2499687 RepID=UPI003D104CF7